MKAKIFILSVVSFLTISFIFPKTASEGLPWARVDNKNLSDWVTCPVCLGSGILTCIFCDGKGKMDCPDCSGTGELNEICSYCSGTMVYGNEPCPGCNALGYIIVKCKTCAGVGGFRCENCSYTGIMPCVMCGGTGKVQTPVTP